MFAITTKAKIAAGIAAGALTLGAAGAYAAANANNTITVTNPTAIPLPSPGPTLVSVDGKTLGTLPTFTNSGECISFFAQNRDFALAPSGTLPTTLKLSKNFHGKLISGLHQWCQTFNTSAQSDTTNTSQSAAPSTDSTDTAGPQSGTHGHGHGHGHGANDLD